MAYCAPCERHFLDETALQQHFNASSRHKPRKPTRPKPAELPSSVSSSRSSISITSRGSRAIKSVNLRTGAQVQTDKPPTNHVESQQRFRTEGAFHQHCNSWAHTPKFYCKDCEKPFPDQNKLDEHMNSNHFPPLHCFNCNKQFFGQQALDQHQRSTSHTSLSCIYCDMHFPNQRLLENHIEHQHLASYNKPEEKIPDLGALTIHKSTIHHKQGFPCSNCSENLPDVAALVQHESTAHAEQGFPCHTCKPLCGRIFNTPEALDTHIQFMIEKLKLSIVRNKKNIWTSISETPASISKLREMTHSKELLEKNLYVMEFPTHESINNQRKCKHCRG